VIPLLALALAAGPSCPLPATLPRPHAELPSAEQPARPLPIASYTLSLIWQPESCFSRRDRSPGDRQCSDERYSTRFTLHGLWPDGAAKGRWPQYCHPVALLTDAQVRAGFCATPSVQLLQHEWAKHGSCTGADPAAYFAEESRLCASLHYPRMTELAHRRDLTAGDVAQAFAAANPGMSADGVRLNVNKKGWLEEVWLCLDVTRRFARCGPGQSDGAAASTPVKVAYPRGTGREGGDAARD
jgi:ribonuclease T2